MDRTERFYKIELLIRNRGSVPFADLMAELGVSRATLKRDLEYLRERMDAPIVYDRDSNGYRFSADEARDARQVRHELPGLWFSEREIHALLTMHQLIGGLDEGGVLARHLQPLLDKPMLLMFAIMVITMVVGTAMDMTPTILILTPVLMPLVKAAGIDPVYFGVLFIMNNAIGLVTPPVGTVLNVVAGVGRMKMDEVTRGVIPFMCAQFGLLFLLVLFPQIVLWPLKLFY